MTCNISLNLYNSSDGVIYLFKKAVASVSFMQIRFVLRCSSTLAVIIKLTKNKLQVHCKHRATLGHGSVKNYLYPKHGEGYWYTTGM